MAISCDPVVLANNAKCYCFPPRVAQAVKLQLLAVIAGLDDLTPSELAERAKCYCLDPITAKKVESYLLCQIANAGTAATCQMLTGVTNPSGNVTPEFVGQLFHNTAGDTWWYSTGLTDTDWTQIVTGGGPCENLEGAGDPI